MTSPLHPDYRRVAVIAPGRRVDLAVPGDVPIADLLPDVLGLSRISAPDHSPGWALGRIGGPVFHTDHSLDELGVRDGDVLLLRPVDLPQPWPVVDEISDLVAAVAAEQGPPPAGHGSRLILCGAGAVLAVALPAVWELRAIGAGATLTAAALLLVGAVVGRGRRDPAPSPILGLAALGYAAIAAAGLPGVPPSAGPLAVATVLFVGSPLLATFLDTGRRIFTAVGSTAGCGIAAGAAYLLGADPEQLAVGTLALAASALPWAPRWAAAIGRLPHPGSAPMADLSDIAPLDLADLRRTARHAVDHLAGLQLGLATTVGVAAVALVDSGGLWPSALAVLGLSILALRAGAAQIADQAVALAVPAILALLGCAAVAGSRLPVVDSAWFPVGLVVLVGGLLGVSIAGPRRAWSPTLRRAGRVTASLIAVAVVPVAVAALDGYGLVRHR